MWENDSAMRAFRNSAAHRNAMQKLPVWCSEASYSHWLQSEPTLPDWSSASEKLLKEGRLTKVRNPSSNQIANHFPGIKWRKLERSFTKRTI